MEVTRIDSLEDLNQRAQAGTLLGLFDVPNELYHRGPGISSSSLKEILRSPAHYEERRANPSGSAAMRLGSIVHTLMLEPHKFETDYAVADCATSGAKIFAITQLANPGKTVVCRNEAEDGAAVAKAIRANALASHVLCAPSGHCEVSTYWIDDETGILCKARADRLIAGVIVDLKTTGDARFQKFQRSAVDFKYHLSAAFYVDGFTKTFGKEHTFAWVVAETERPHGIAFYGADEALIETGRAEYKLALRAYKEHSETHFVSSYPESFVSLSLPGYYI